MLRPPTRSALLLVLALTGACKKPGRLDLLLRASDDLDLTAVANIEVRLLEDATGAEVGRATVAGSDLAALPELLGKSKIGPNVDYVFEVRATVDTGVCASGRVVGRSLPLSVESDTSTDTATAYVGCTDAFAPTGRTNEERAGHAAIWAPAQGGALIIGGASRLEYAAARADALASVERYDVATGHFTSEPALHEARVLPGAALDAEGRVVVLGGVSNSFVPAADWLDSVEEIDGDERHATGQLDGRWLDPRPLSLTDGTLALLGFGVKLLDEPLGAIPYQVSFYDPRTEQVPHDAIESGSLNGIAVPFPDRARALLVGGDGGDEPLRPHLFCEAGQCGCSGGGCLVPLGDDDDTGTWGSGPRWTDGAGAYLPCAEGGGTAYVIGGRIHPDLGAPEESVGGVYCYRDEDEPSAGDFVRIGELPARTNQGVVALRGDRLLVVGGYSEGGGLSTALILTVPSCACEGLAPADVSEVVLDPDLRAADIVLARSAVTLGDGTVLVTGRTTVVDAALNLDAGTDAWVFNPDLP